MGFSKFIAKLTNSSKTAPFNAGVFNNDLAIKTSWQPLVSGGSNFKAKTLKQISPSELRFVASTFGKIFVGVFMTLPLFFLGGAVFVFFQEGFDSTIIPFTLIPLVFFGVGLFLLKTMNRVVVFDKNTGDFYKGKKKRDLSPNTAEDKNSFKLETIQALQIIPEYIRGNKSSYYSYEINIIFQDGSRYNVVDHGHQPSIEQDGITLSNFLGVPLWNKIDGTSHIPKTSKTTSGSYNSLQEHDIIPSSSKKSSKSNISSDLDDDYDSLQPREM